MNIIFNNKLNKCQEKKSVRCYTVTSKFLLLENIANDKLILQIRILNDFKSNKEVELQNTKVKKKSIDSYEFCGMWKNREDLKDSVAWVRNIRNKED